MDTANHNSLAFSNTPDAEPEGTFDAVITAVALFRVQAETKKHNQRGVALQAQGNLHGAIAAYDHALALNPHFPEARFNRAVACLALGDTAGALTDCNKALELNPAFANAWNARGAVRSDLDDLAGAIADFDEALRLNPHLAAAYNNRGVARKTQGDLHGALADFDGAIRLQPNYAEAYSNRGSARTSVDDLAGAEADFQCALALAPDNANAHARRGVLLQRQKNWSAALAEYDYALKLHPRLFWVYILRGNTRYHIGDWRGLCADYKTAFMLQPERAANLVLRTLGPGLASGPAEALRDCEEHLRQAPDDPMSHARRGLLLMMSQRDSEATGEFEFCQTGYPEAKPYLELLVEHVKRLRKCEDRRRETGDVAPDEAWERCIDESQEPSVESGAPVYATVSRQYACGDSRGIRALRASPAEQMVFVGRASP
jgi:tetratricopeptide (TPR) repeat protein